MRRDPFIMRMAVSRNGDLKNARFSDVRSLKKQNSWLEIGHEVPGEKLSFELLVGCRAFEGD
jgi:hypothetical protein